MGPITTRPALCKRLAREVSFPGAGLSAYITGHVGQARRISFEVSTPRGCSLQSLLYPVRRVRVPLASALLSALVGLPCPGVGSRSRVPSRSGNCNGNGRPPASTTKPKPAPRTALCLQFNALWLGAPWVSSPLGQRLADGLLARLCFLASDSVGTSRAT